MRSSGNLGMRDGSYRHLTPSVRVISQFDTSCGQLGVHPRLLTNTHPLPPANPREDLHALVRLPTSSDSLPYRAGASGQLQPTQVTWVSNSRDFAV
jgi:hypothetical protein